MITRTAGVSQAERPNTEHFLVEAVRRSLQRRVTRWVGVKRIGTNHMRRRSHGGDVRVFRGSPPMALELRLGPVAELIRKKRGLRP